MPRRPFDFYETPPHYVHALQRVYPFNSRDMIVLEPCVGEGAIANLFVNAIRNDLDTRRSAEMHGDARDPRTFARMLQRAYRYRQSPVIITNPPFNAASIILRAALKSCPMTPIAFLLRLSFLEPTVDRADLLRDHPPTGLIVLPRYSFRLNDKGKRQTDSVTCAWMIWNAHIDPAISIDGTRPA